MPAERSWSLEQRVSITQVMIGLGSFLLAALSFILAVPESKQWLCRNAHIFCLASPPQPPTPSGAGNLPAPPLPSPAPQPAAPSRRYVARCVFYGDTAAYFVTADNDIVGVPLTGQTLLVGKRLPPTVATASWTYHRNDGVEFAVDFRGMIWSPLMPSPIGYVVPL